jgi:hypothetical protein
MMPSDLGETVSGLDLKRPSCDRERLCLGDNDNKRLSD